MLACCMIANDVNQLHNSLQAIMAAINQKTKVKIKSRKFYLSTNASPTIFGNTQFKVQ